MQWPNCVHDQAHDVWLDSLNACKVRHKTSGFMQIAEAWCVLYCVYMQMQAILYKWIHAVAWCVYMQILAILY
jgi:hypothetical protein